MDLREVSALIVKGGVALGADEVAALTAHGTSRQVRFANNEITVTQTWDEVEAAMLVKKDRRVLTASITDVSREGIEKALRDLLAMTRVVRPHGSYAPLPEGPFRYRTIPGLYDDGIAELGERATDYVEAAINAALESGGERAAGTLLAVDSDSCLATSRGVEGARRKTAVNMVVRCLADGEASGMGVACGTTLRGFDPEEAGREAGRLAGMSRSPVSARPGRYEVVLGRPASAVIFDVVAGMASAFHVDSGESCLAERLGERVASEELSLWDDPGAPGGLGSTPFDDEGRPTRRTEIIQEGTLRSYLHNSLTAEKHGTESTANAGWIAPHAWNLVVAGGRLTDEELMEGVREGLYVNNVTYLRFQDYRRGDFSAIARDGVFRIENGEITRAVRGLRLSDNVLRMLRNTTGLSKEVVQVSHWWMEWGTPSVKTPLIRVRGTGFTVPTK